MKSCENCALFCGQDKNLKPVQADFPVEYTFPSPWEVFFSNLLFRGKAKTRILVKYDNFLIFQYPEAPNEDTTFPEVAGSDIFDGIDIPSHVYKYRRAYYLWLNGVCKLYPTTEIVKRTHVCGFHR
jgi:hypothetical protein